MRLLIPIFLNILLALLFSLLEKNPSYKKLPYMVKQVIIGITFGGSSAFASSYGVELLGTTVNVRDAAPLSSGLIFGAPAGVIAGVIGGAYRWFSVFWGAGTYTRLACALATVLAGVLVACIRKLLFDNKKSTWGYAVCITVVCEVIHMILIFLTNMDDSAYAFEFVKGATIPMILGNAVAVGVAVLVTSLLSREGTGNKKGSAQISYTFQRWLLVCILVAYVVTSVFTFVLQNGMAKIETQETFTSAINDVVNDVTGKSEEELLSKAEGIEERYLADPEQSLVALAEEFGVAEINVVDKDGLIINSSVESYIGAFNMKSTEQSAEFMVLTGDVEHYVQAYCPTGDDESIMRKYAGIKLQDGGFLQVGYDADQFHNAIDGFVTDVTKNRHIGSNGFIAVCDENLNMVTQNEKNGLHISDIGIEPNEEMLSGKSASQLYETNIVNSETDYSEKYIYVFTFVEGYCIIAAIPEAEAMFMRDASLYTSVFTQVLIFATLFVFIYFLIKKVIINNLRKINGKLAEITDGNLNVVVDVRSNEEFASLSDDINSTVETLKRYIDEAAARIDKELEYAKQIQLSALPTDFPDNEDYTIYAGMMAAKEVGGDFYDFYKLSDTTVAFLAADVSGKGIPAAMFMMTAKTIIKDLAERGLPVNEIFERANEKLCENNESGMFVTAWMGVLDLETGALKFANAGHNPPLLRRANGDFEYLRSRAGFVLAGMEGVKYRINELNLSAGDRLFLYTDGVTEATNVEKQLYGEDRLIQYMNDNKSTASTELLPGLKADIDLFVGEAPQFDDITMLMLDYRRGGNMEVYDRSFSAEEGALPDVIAFVEEILENVGCPMKAQTALCVAIEEVFVNVAKYAYGDESGEVQLTITFDKSDNTVAFKMLDGGVPFDPLKKPDPDITLSADEREIGGLGIFITKKTMDSISYEYENDKNILTMVKKI